MNKLLSLLKLSKNLRFFCDFRGKEVNEFTWIRLILEVEFGDSNLPLPVLWLSIDKTEALYKLCYIILFSN